MSKTIVKRFQLLSSPEYTMQVYNDTNSDNIYINEILVMSRKWPGHNASCQVINLPRITGFSDIEVVQRCGRQAIAQYDI